MSDHQPETPDTDPELLREFDRILIEAPLAELEEFIAEAPQLLALSARPPKSLEFLRNCKARVDARLSAEQEQNVFSMSDPHQIRIRCWEDIAGRFEAEINFRSGKSPQSQTEHPHAQNSTTTARNFESGSASSGALPRSWEELQNQNSISQKQAAQYLKCDPRTVRRLVKAQKLTRSPKGRIVCNEQLRYQIRRVHGNQVLR
jgi:hypothetical protein